MALILHLSDLHLLPPTSMKTLGTTRQKSCRRESGKLDVSLLRNTLRGLRLRLEAPESRSTRSSSRATSHTKEIPRVWTCCRTSVGVGPETT